MRNAFIRALEGIARNDRRVVLLTPDMGFSVFEKFRTKRCRVIFSASENWWVLPISLCVQVNLY